MKNNKSAQLIVDFLIDILGETSREKILEKMALHFVSELNINRVSIFLFDEDGDYLKSSVNYVDNEFINLDIIFFLDEESLAVNSFKEGKIIVAEDVEKHPLTHKDLVRRFGDKTLFAVPVSFRDKTIGVTILGWTGKHHLVTDYELDKAAELCNLLGIILSVQMAIEKEKINRAKAIEFQRIVDELYNMSKIIQKLPISKRLGEILQKAKNVIGFDRINVFVSSSDGKWLECIASTEQDVIVDPIKIPLDERGGGLTQCFSRKSDIYFNGRGDIPDILRIGEPYSEIRAIRSRHFFITPIIIGEDIIGVIGADNRFSKKPIRSDAIEILKIFSSYIAYTIENYRLFNRVIEEEAEWTKTFNAIDDPIFIVDNGFNIIKANSAFLKATGLSAEEVVLKKCYDLFCKKGFHDDICPLRIFQKDPARKIPEFELNINERFYIVSAFPFFTRDGIAERFIHVAKDVTDYKKLKEEIFHAEKLASMGRLVSSVSHEINNPLTSIIGFTHLLLKYEEDESKRAFLDVIRKESERIMRITKDLLQMGRKGREERTKGNINDILRDIIRLRSYHWGINNIAVHSDLDASIPDTVADFFRLRQAFFNIILNAEDAIKEYKNSGNIRIITRNDALNGRIQIEIADDGCGIPESLLPRIFEPFFTTKDTGKGTGLGLSLSHHIIEEHGGQIHVKSHVGEGTTFIITLPIQE